MHVWVVLSELIERVSFNTLCHRTVSVVSSALRSSFTSGLIAVSWRSTRLHRLFSTHLSNCNFGFLSTLEVSRDGNLNPTFPSLLEQTNHELLDLIHLSDLVLALHEALYLTTREAKGVDCD